jgi:GNAT superfamily N-acetyltransferase
MSSRFLPVAPGEIATVVTHLEMRARPGPRPVRPVPLRLKRWKAPGIDKYRALYRRVGEPWLWFSRLAMADEALEAILADPAVEIFAVLDPRGIEIGLLELDFREAADCEIAFFGLIPQLTGQGFGTCGAQSRGISPVMRGSGSSSISRPVGTKPCAI